jgi:hypothetical protein
MTINRMMSDPAKSSDDCSAQTPDGRTLCAHTLYHYEIDETGKLYFAKVTAYGEKDSSILQPGATALIFICQLNSELACEIPELDNLPFDLSAYTISGGGVTVHSLANPWENSQKAVLFLNQIKANADTALKTGNRTQSQMMDDLVCYVFDFDALVDEYKDNGRLVDARSTDLLKPEACLVSFHKICRDPGSRADELDLAANADTNDHNMFKKPRLNAKDINKFCRSIEESQAAMLR